MRRKGWLVGLLTVMALVVTACGQSASGDEKVLRVGATGQSYPFAYKEGEELKGFDVEVMEAVADKLGYELEWQLTEFSGLMGQLEAGKLDTIANQVAVTEERKEKYNFTDPYAYAGSQIVVKEDNKTINSVDDLAGKTVAAVLGSNHAKNLEKQDPDKKIKIRTYETQEGTLNDVAYGRVDAYVNARSVLIAQIEKSELPLRLAGDPFVYEEVALPFKKDEAHDEMREKVDQALAELREDGTLQTLSEKYFKDDVTVKKEEE
ncbi:amino acid ABC transporter substrate-binding protein (PAAT family) [Desmospora activa DSM 45169]|uniref:Amino acid ABC transporter substrate-binding protein (PAAT family) n=2 Tax=Desmospora TaxID=500614 RepID=A0A2T4Z3T7_9BACL|nr:amino acid ABC transporter substrate-binding protein [Desmospora activa]PTM56560.1 amino acid ABC transporter substrate-binding protein (PAAT family) [Desmospora activa DSM 45169]